MHSIGLVGVNTYHAEAFTRIFNGSPDTPPRIADSRITHVWAGEHPERLDELQALLGPYDVIVADPAEMIDEVDGVLVVDDTGGGAAHAELARPFIAAGIPTFIDKPMTTSYTDAVALFDLAAQRGTPVFSSSALRFPVELDRSRVDALGSISAIVSVGPEEWFYYGVHAVEVVGTVTGARPLTVHRTALPEKDVAVITYEGGLSAVVMTLRDAQYLFQVSVYGEKGSYTFDVNDGMGFYTNEMRAFVAMIGSGIPPVTAEETLTVLAILHAGNLSAAEQRVVAIDEITGGAG